MGKGGASIRLGRVRVKDQMGANAMQALKEVYLPELGLWLADYPYLSRRVFLNISMEIERTRQAEQQAAMDSRFAADKEGESTGWR
jgi:hypothetical protein